MDDKTLYWLDLSDYDIKTAEAMLETKRYLYVGFMCHQCIEKLFKALISEKELDVAPKIHNLIRLAELCQVFENMPERHKETIFLLNPLNIESRYPTYKEDMLKQLDDEKCKSILDSTKELIEWIRQQL